MARPSSAAAAARVLVGACLSVAFLLLLLAFFCLSRRGVSLETASSKKYSRNVLRRELEGYGHGGCDGARGLEVDGDRCDHHAAGSSSDSGCYHPRGYVDYLYLFYCVCGDERRVLGYGAMAAWLAVLFYLLGDTAAVYFCSSLEGLSRLLRLSPAIAGVTLLSLGNGAPDALSTVASFASGGGGAGGEGGTTVVGLNGVLGGALFVSSVVLGVICLRIGGRGVAVDRASFFRDASFLLIALAAVAVVLAGGVVNIWGAFAFTSLYLVYVLAVAFTHGRTRKGPDGEAEADHAAVSSELCDVAETNFYADQEPLLPETAPLLQYYADDAGDGDATKKKRRVFWSVVRVLELPLSLPRRLTIPDASKERWSKPAAVTAATLAPLFLSFLWSHATGNPPLALLFGGLGGISLGITAFLTTDADAPPAKFLTAWLAGGFVMSVAWAYVIANELLSLLVSAVLVLSVDPATVGLTVLAWGNSLGDLIANMAVAVAARDGAQVAVAGCYGGPVFNVLVGLGLSLLLSCWAGYPRPVEIPREPRIYQTLGFVAAGLLWALVVLPRRGMRVDRTLGFGLLAIYLCFLCINISQALGLAS